MSLDEIKVRGGAKLGNKLKRDMRFRPEILSWVDDMVRQGGGKWTFTAVVEWCIEQGMRAQRGVARPDRMVDQLDGMAETIERVAAGVERLRAFASLELEERFLPERDRAATLEEFVARMEANGDG